MALPKFHRLRHRRDFSAVYRSGLRRSTPHLTLIALKRRSPYPTHSSQSLSTQDCDEQDGDSQGLPKLATESFTQIGVSISQKVSKRAVVRNRIKRQIQSAIYQLLPDFLQGWRIVIVVRPEATRCDYGQLLQELRQLLKKSEVVNGH